MTWFCNNYDCARCGTSWTDEWSCMCDDDCPYCGVRDMSPVRSDDLTEINVREGDRIVPYYSPDTAEHEPKYTCRSSFAISQKQP